jgi:hypothetical protein
MRKLALLSLLLVPSGLVACSAILGDFTVSNVYDAGDSGGGDGGGGDVVSDAPSDAPTLFKLSCVESANQRIQITKNLSLHPQRMRMAAMANGLVRIIATDQPPPAPDAGNQSPPVVLQSYTIDPHNTGNGFSPVPLPTNGNNVYSIVRYGGPKPGFAALYEAYDQNSNTNVFYAVRLPDDGNAWTTPVTLLKMPNSGNNNNLEVSFAVVDAANEIYYVVMSSNDGSTQTISGAQVTGNHGDSLTTLDTFADTQTGRNTYDFVDPMIAIRGPQAFLMLTPNGNNGPPPQGTPALMLVPGKPDVLIKPPSNLNYFPVGFEGAIDPQKVNAAFLVADLNALAGSYNVGQVAASSLNTLDPQSLPATAPPTSDGGSFTLADLFVNGQADHWEVAGAVGEQFLMTSPTADPLSQQVFGGINFGWWDGQTGTLRSYEAGGNRLLKDVQYIGTTDTTFTLLVGSIASLYVAYTSYPTQPTQNFPPPAADLWIATIGCQKQ